jgi:HEAT repeat protein
MTVAQALGRIGKRNPMVIDELLRLLKDPDSDVRMTAAQSLGGISKRHPMVVDELLKWMKQD